MIDNDRFCSSVIKATSLDITGDTIGTLGEKVLHRALKIYLEPREECREVPVCDYVADILNEQGITEIQTGAISVLKGKLANLLKGHKVCLVHPIICEKFIRKIDDETAEISPPRRSPRHKGIYDIGFELFKIRELIENKNFCLKVFILSADEYIRKDRRNKRGIQRVERIPRRIIDELSFCCAEDYLMLLPEGLGDEFSASEFKTAIKSKSRYTYYCLRLLCELGLLERRTGRGRGFVYSRSVAKCKRLSEGD